ncbi:PREDICTED: protein cereblon-like, partial [Diuraphis noxia]|uniref:protein cereblon-like n=1 Tax=Diuraphis noxia TaxID=143948 RepID=UPI0007635A10
MAKWAAGDRATIHLFPKGIRVLTCTEARVKIIKDTTLYYPLTKLCLDKKNRSFGDSRICSKRSMFQTLWPSWVYKQFDVYELASNITKKIKILSTDQSVVNYLVYQNVRISDDPIFLSFQVTKLGLFSETQINELFGIDSTNLRLQLELNFLNNLNVVEEYVCAGSDCGVQVCNLKTMFSVSSTQTHKSNCKYWNSSRDMITISYLDDYVNKIKFVNKSTECSCFPGYNSTSIICKTCNSHLGWSFVVNGSMSVMPTSFYGLSITALIKSSVKIDP